MKSAIVKANLALFLAAVIWGVAFVAQRVGMDYVGPFTFNGVRFALGGLSLLPLILFYGKQNPQDKSCPQHSPLASGVLAGIVLFIAASLQQIGLVYTTAGKAAFLTSLYIVIVPMLGVFLHQYISASAWAGSLLAIGGVYLLSVNEEFSIAYGDLVVLIGAFFWAGHILLIDAFSRRVDAIKLAFVQFLTCSVLSLLVAVIWETITIHSLRQVLIPLFYGGVCSVGIAYTLQIIGQKHAKPAHASIILSMEAIFAALGGWLLLQETMSLQALLGCCLMLVGMLLSQMTAARSNETELPKCAEVTQGK